MKIVTIDTAAQYILSSGGQFFAVHFNKRKTGEDRHMVARLGVRKGVTGKGMKFDPGQKLLIPVWDRNKRDFRMIPVDNLTKIKINGKWCNVQGATGKIVPMRNK